MSFTQTILDRGNFIIVPRPLVEYMGIQTTIFFMWLVSHHKNIKQKSRNLHEFFFDAGIVEEQTGLSLYQQNRIIIKLVDLGLLKIVGRKRYNRKCISIRYRKADKLLIALYSKETKEQYYKETKEDPSTVLKKLDKLKNKNKGFNKNKEKQSAVAKADGSMLVSSFGIPQSNNGQNRFYYKRSIQLYRILQSKRKIFRKVNIDGWANHFKGLHIKDKVEKDQIREVLNWYVKHIGQEYIPEAFSAESFRKKFDQIANKMNQSQDPKRKKDYKPGDPEDDFKTTTTRWVTKDGKKRSRVVIDES